MVTFKNNIGRVLMQTTCLPALALAAAVSFAPVRAVAQAPAPAPAAEEEVQQAEIIVTATRRDIGLSKVPLSITALTNDALTNRGIRSIDDIARAAPGLSFNSAGNGLETISVRGIVGAGNGATTALYLDEIPISQINPIVFSPRYFDLERVEVLRGPQGTLYGSSAMGGAIRIITAKPNLTKVEGVARVEGSATKAAGRANFIADAALSVPIISDVLALRLTGYYERNRSPITRFTPQFSSNPADYVDEQGNGGFALNGLSSPNGVRLGGQELYGGRATLRAVPTEAITLTGSYSWQRRNNQGFTAEDEIQSLGFSGGDLRQARSVNEFRIIRSQLANFTAQIDFGFAELTSSTSLEHSRERGSTDLRQFGTFANAVALLGVVPRDAEGRAGTAFLNLDTTRSFTQEVRLVSSSDGPLSWIVGGFYNNSRTQIDNDVVVFGLTDLLRGTPDEGQVVNDRGAFTALRSRIREISVFGELSYKLTDNLGVTLGLRRYDLKTNRQAFTIGFLSQGGQITDPVSGSEKGFTYKALINYQAKENLLVYGSFSTGYRPGIANPVPLPGDSPSPRQSESDRLRQYELGAKTRVLGGALNINAALFYIDWSNIQVPGDSNSGIGFTFNGPSARTVGGEVELVARPTKGLDVSLGITVLDAKYTANLVTNGVNFVRGDLLPEVPKYSVNNAVNYEWSIGTDMTARVGGDVSLTSARRGTVTSPDTAPLSSFAVAGLSAGISFRKFDVSIFARNLFNERGVVGNSLGDNEIINGVGSIPSRNTIRIPGRTIGASLEMRF